MLFRLDYLNADGSTAEAVRDIAGEALCRHMTTARKLALDRSDADDRAILITRIGKAGQLRPCLVVNPGGRCTRPGGMDGEDCVRDSGRTCFCRNCRAERRAGQ